MYLNKGHKFAFNKRKCLTVTLSALAGVHIGPIDTLGAIFAGGAGTLIDVNLALVPRIS